MVELALEQGHEKVDEPIFTCICTPCAYMQDPYLLARCADTCYLVLSGDDSEARPIDIKAVCPTRVCTSPVPWRVPVRHLDATLGSPIRPLGHHEARRVVAMIQQATSAAAAAAKAHRHVDQNPHAVTHCQGRPPREAESPQMTLMKKIIIWFAIESARTPPI